MTKIEKARIFATAAHAAVAQKRKYTGEDYIVHPGEVAAMVEAAGGTEDMIAAAWLHDVLEDTKVEIMQLNAVMGPEVTILVTWLTDVSKKEDGNRAIRKAIDRDHSMAAPAAAQTVKVADLISNSRSIFTHDLNFAKTYAREKEQLLAVLTKADAGLRAEAEAILAAYRASKADAV